MSAALDYLEAEEREQLAAQLRQQGFTVEEDYHAGDQIIDLIASKGGERIAFEVKARPNLRNDLRQLRELRSQAFHEGITEFRLVVVSPPHQTSVSIPGLERLLARRMQDAPPGSLQHLSPNVLIESVGSLEISAISVTTEGIDLTGTGAVEVAMGIGGSRDEAQIPDTFPFRFHILLGHDLRLLRADELDVDVSSFEE